MTYRVALALALVAAVAPGCGDEDPADDTSSNGASGPGASGPGGSEAGGSGGAGATGGSGGAPFDLGAGTWEIDNVSNTPGTISHDGALVLLGGGSAVVAFSEPDSDNLTDQDIWIATLDGATWSGEPITADVGIQNAFPSMRAHDGTVYVVYNGYPNGVNEIYYARSEGGGPWTEGLDLTGEFEGPGTRRTDYAPSLAIDSAGNRVFAYVSQPADDTGSSTGPGEIRVMLFIDGGADGAATTVIPAVGDGCFDPKAVFDAAGALHVVADCGTVGSEDMYYATNASGSWESMSFGDVDGSDDFSGALALAPDGETVHVAWVSAGPCGADTCMRVLHGRITGGTVSEGVEVVAPTELEATHPAIGVDTFGRPLVAFHAFNADNYGDVYLTWSEDDGATFAPPRNLTPDTPMSDEWFAESIVFDPEAGTPQLLFEALLPGSDPVDAEVMRAVFVP